MNDRPLIDKDDVPLLVRVMAFPAPLFPTATDAQFNEVGLTDPLPEVVVEPVPVKAMD